MSRRSETIRAARHAKLERRWLATFPQPTNEKPRMREQHPGFDFETPPSVSCKPFAKTLAGQRDV